MLDDDISDFSCEKCRDVAGNFPQQSLPRLPGAPRRVRRDDEIIHLLCGVEEGMIGVRWFLGNDIQRCPTQASLAERLNQRRFVNQGSTCCIDQEGGWFHQGKGSVVDEVSCFWRQRTVEGDDIGIPE